MSLFLFHERVGDFFVVLFFWGLRGLWFGLGLGVFWFVLFFYNNAAVSSNCLAQLLVAEF